MSTKPTAKPWKLTHDEPYEMSIDGPDGKTIEGITLWLDDCCYDTNDRRLANAKEVVRSVNMHDDLVRALSNLDQAITEFNQEDKVSRLALRKALIEAKNLAAKAKE